MEQILFALFIAEISYALVGLDLLRRAKKTGGVPELFLGLAFVFNGLSYFFTDLPLRIGHEQILNEFSFIGRILAGLCSLTIAAFTWRVFRGDARWAKGFVWGAGILLAVGAAVSAFEGDWEGAHPLSYAGFWFEWIGGFAPFPWLAIESLHAYSKGRRQVRLGLGDPLVSNRFLLIGLYGVLASLTYPLFLWMYIVYELHGVWSDPLSVLAGVVEIFSLVALWISFSAPAFYRNWVSSPQASA
jgi:hypothetical protein